MLHPPAGREIITQAKAKTKTCLIAVPFVKRAHELECLIEPD
jgi:hypothetical protein